MKNSIKQGAILAAAWLVTSTGGWAASDVILGNVGNDWVIAYDAESNLLLVQGDDSDNSIEIAHGIDGSVRFISSSIERSELVLQFRTTPLVAIHGGGGDDVIVGRRIPVLVLNGGGGNDTLVWDNGGESYQADAYAGDMVMWSDSKDGDGSVYGGAGLDVLIGNTGGDRIEFGDLGNDWLVGGTGRGDIVGGWGNDWISGGTGTDGSDGGNDLLSAAADTETRSALTSPTFRGGVYVAAEDVN